MLCILEAEEYEDDDDGGVLVKWHGSGKEQPAQILVIINNF